MPYTINSILQSAGVPVATGQLQDSSGPSVQPTKSLAANKHENVANLIGSSRLLLGLAGGAAFVVMLLLLCAISGALSVMYIFNVHGGLLPIGLAPIGYALEAIAAVFFAWRFAVRIVPKDSEVGVSV